MSVPMLLFVYNADGGLASALIDVAHKVVSPATYQCRLCALTYGVVSMRRPWRDFIATLPLPVEFLHRDDFHRDYGQPDIPLPAIFLRNADGTATLWLSAEQINNAKSLEALQDLIRGRFADNG